ncbi:hypothetical protein COV82_00370 [Candidatus Peregrinibacteria bacterium CG11_big_fil_rev_8_21_14_0_20_46_8]|nr:MAG: hypothetical protein COV82_00370 [Candidatus Peregrinibacteria bacterium CG11_big_fil_rev_8_21_14_0_20_46_8]
MLRTKTFGLAFIVAIFVLSGCGAPQPSATQSGGLTFEGYTFGRTTADGQIEATETNVYKPGDQVHLILQNVGPFKADDEGKHHLEMDLEIENDAGEIIFEQKNILEETGITQLEQGIADTPYGTFHSNAALPLGTYTMMLTVYDKVGGGEVSQTAPFIFE